MTTISIQPLQQKHVAIERYLTTCLVSKTKPDDTLTKLVDVANQALSKHQEVRKNSEGSIQGEVEFLEYLPRLKAAFDICIEGKLFKKTPNDKLTRLLERVALPPNESLIITLAKKLEIELIRLKDSPTSMLNLTSSQSAKRINQLTTQLKELVHKDTSEILKKHIVARSLRSLLESTTNDHETLIAINENAQTKFGAEKFRTTISFLRDCRIASGIALDGSSGRDFSLAASAIKASADLPYDCRTIETTKNFIEIKQREQSSLTSAKGSLFDQFVELLQEKLNTSSSVNDAKLKHSIHQSIINSFSDTIKGLPLFNGASLVTSLSAIATNDAYETAVHEQLNNLIETIKYDLANKKATHEQVKREEQFNDQLMQAIVELLNQDSPLSEIQSANIRAALEYFDSYFESNKSKTPAMISLIKDRFSILSGNERQAHPSAEPSVSTVDSAIARSDIERTNIETSNIGTTPSSEVKAFEEYLDSDAPDYHNTSELNSGQEVREIEELLDSVDDNPTQAASAKKDDLDDQHRIDRLLKELEEEREARRVAEAQILSRRSPLTEFGDDTIAPATSKRLEALTALYKSFHDKGATTNIGVTAEIVSLELDIGSALSKKPGMVFNAKINNQLSETTSLYEELLFESKTFGNQLSHNVIRARFESGLKACDFSLSSPLNVSPFEIFETSNEFKQNGPSLAIIRSLCTTISTKLQDNQVRQIDQGRIYHDAMKVKNVLVNECITLLGQSIEAMPCNSQQAARSVSHALNGLIKELKQNSSNEAANAIPALERTQERFEQGGRRAPNERIEQLSEPSFGGR